MFPPQIWTPSSTWILFSLTSRGSAAWRVLEPGSLKKKVTVKLWICLFLHLNPTTMPTNSFNVTYALAVVITKNCHPSQDIKQEKNVTSETQTESEICKDTKHKNCSIGDKRNILQSYLKELWGLVAGVVCLDGGVMVPSSCSLSVSTVEWLSGVVAPLSWGVGWLLMDSIRELRTTGVES